jgi:predicted DNA-binding transcriptional regulator YafY
LRHEGFPYGDDRELIGDILRHGPAVEGLAPRELRTRCRDHPERLYNLPLVKICNH